MPFLMHGSFDIFNGNSKLLNALCNVVDVNLQDLTQKHLEAVARGDSVFQLFKPACAAASLQNDQNCPVILPNAGISPCSPPVLRPETKIRAVKLLQPLKVCEPARSSATTASEDSQSCCYVNSPISRSPAHAAEVQPEEQILGKRRRACSSSSNAKRPVRVVKHKPTAASPKPGGTSSYRGVSWHEQTAKWKAQIKVNGYDVNLGRHKNEEEAARAYDRAAVCARGLEHAKLNFPLCDYADEIDELISSPLPELAAKLRGVEERLQQQTSRYHGVRLNKRTMKWEAYIRISGKHIHLGCYQNECEAAQAFDQAAIVRMMCRPNTKHSLATNFSVRSYKTFLAKLGKAIDGAELLAVLPESLAEDAGAGGFELPRKYLKVLLAKCKEEES